MGLDTTGPIGIGVTNNGRRRTTSESESKVESAFDVSQNTFDSKKVIVGRLLEKLTNNINSIREIWTSDCQILQSTNQRTI